VLLKKEALSEGGRTDMKKSLTEGKTRLGISNTEEESRDLGGEIRRGQKKDGKKTCPSRKK